MGERRGTKALELWCRRLIENYPGVKIDNMTTSWRDGLAFCAMVHHFRPDLIEFSKLNKKDVYYNNDLAFRTAETQLGIPALLDAADMASYEVPDRLSILTYLSQYYQAFAAQGSPARLNIKRTSTVMDKSSISKSTSPPSKMAHVVGVPKREPCQKCQLPVFLAERLIIGKHLYHRTCLKCARCTAQLTPGSFYETEVDGEFCCETCPDEEKQLPLNSSIDHLIDNIEKNIQQPSASSSTSSSLNNTTISKNTSTNNDRKSFSEKLALFQSTDGKNNLVLQKSLSDEEKSKSLKKLNYFYGNGDGGTATTTTDYKTNSALNSFMTSQMEHQSSNLLDGNDIKKPSNNDNVDDDADEDDDDEDDDESSSDDDTTDNTDNTIDDIPPALPNTKPPSFQEDISGTLSIDNNDKAALNTHPIDSNNSTISSTTTTTTTTITTISNNLNATNNTSQLINDNFSVNNNNNFSSKQISELSVSDHNAEKIMHTSNNSNDDIKNNDNEQLILSDNINKDLSLNENVSKYVTKDDKDEKNVDSSQSKQHQSPQRSSMVQSRLHQFESMFVTQSLTPTTITNPAPTSTIQSHAINNIHTDKNNNNANAKEEKIFTTSQMDESHSNIDQKEIKNVDVQMNSENNEKMPAVSEKQQISNNNKNENISDISEYNNNKFENNIISLNSENVNNNANYISETLIKCKNENEIDNMKVSQEITVDQIDHCMISEKEEQQNIDLSMDEKIDELITITEIIDDQPKKDDILKTPIPTKRLNNNKADRLNVKPQIPLRTNNNNNNNNNNIDAHQMVTTKDKHVEEIIKNNNIKEYPIEQNPFGNETDEDEESEQSHNKDLSVWSAESEQLDKSKRNSFNPFDSSDDEIELLKKKDSPFASTPKQSISTNPFGSESDEDNNNYSIKTSQGYGSKRTPVPIPRKSISLSLHTTPEPTPRMTRVTPHQQQRNHVSDYDNELLSSSSLMYKSYDGKLNNTHGSTISLASSTSSATTTTSGVKRKKGKAPLPPSITINKSQNDELIVPSSRMPSGSIVAESQRDKSPSTQSILRTPTSNRKKRPAPKPPTLSTMNNNDNITPSADEFNMNKSSIAIRPTTLNLSNELNTTINNSNDDDSLNSEQTSTDNSNAIQLNKKIIPLEDSLINDNDNFNESLSTTSIIQQKIAKESDDVVYRRTIKPLTPLADDDTDEEEDDDDDDNNNDRQWVKIKENKESENKNRQSQILLQQMLPASPSSTGESSSDPLHSNKSSYGKWKRRKGPAPSLPVPPKKILPLVPLEEIRHELEVIESQQQGLEKQGVILEKMIRERCETDSIVDPLKSNDPLVDGNNQQNSKEVEDLILQLFELVNDKNELFRRQAELMYLRRQHRLEQEQADIEYQIRLLMAQPEFNKTDSFKAHEETLIARLVEVVRLRNEVVDCLEMDRLREAEEDQSIKEQLEIHSAKRDQELHQQTPTKLSKKEKKKQKEAKKLAKQQKIDADKDADETEIKSEKIKDKKKKKKFLF